MKLPPDLKALHEAVGRHDECTARIWKEIDRVIDSGGIDVNERLTALYRQLDESVADVGRVLYQILDGQYPINECIRMCSGSRLGLNPRQGLISPVIRSLVDEWQQRSRRLAPCQPSGVAADKSLGD